MFTMYMRLGCALGVALVFVFVASPVLGAQNSPEIPFHKAWAASPHANASSESFRHWDKDGKVPKACAMCHSAGGFRDFIGADGSAAGTVDNAAATDSVIDCVTCHNPMATKLDTVTFPSGISIANVGNNARCMTCHQGRQSGEGVDNAIGNLAADTVSDKLSFLNVHYRAAAATMWGSVAKVGYEYQGADYQGATEHWNKLNECVECHDPHSLQVRVDVCERCHGPADNVEALRAIRWQKGDFDGDGDSREGIFDEIKTLEEKLLGAMMTYATSVTKKPLGYESHTYPYFFNDTNTNGKIDADEAKYPNQYKSWTPRLLKAAYNYQFALKDPGAYAHNPRYVMQLLYDSIADLSARAKVDLKGMTRP